MKAKRMVTILRPEFPSQTNARHRLMPTLNDYIAVPWIDTLGTFKMVEMFGMEELTALAVLRERLGANSHAGTIGYKLPKRLRHGKVRA